MHRIEHEKAVAVARAEKAKKEAREAAGKLSAIAITIAQKAGDDGTLFGSVTAKDIERRCKAQGLRGRPQEDRSSPSPSRRTGTFEITVPLVSDVAATLKVEVVAK